MTATCPKDHLPDRYEVEVLSHRTIFVEDILAIAAEIGGAEEHLAQEEITAQLARRLAARVITRGYHSGVLVEVRA
jgi:hypothetical protein